MSNRTRNRHGALTLTAVLILALVGSAAAVVAATTSRDARRTADERTQAQLRALIAAGVAQAESSLGIADPVRVILPDTLRAAGAEVTVRVEADGDRATVHVRARYAGRPTTRDVRFARDDRGWHPIERERRP